MVQRSINTGQNIGFSVIEGGFLRDHEVLFYEVLCLLVPPRHKKTALKRLFKNGGWLRKRVVWASFPLPNVGHPSAQSRLGF